MRYRLDARHEHNREALVAMIAGESGDHGPLEVVDGDPETDLAVTVEGPPGLRGRRLLVIRED